ncbi:MAG: hypothetical protein WC586_03525 [Methanoregula sp.]
MNADLIESFRKKTLVVYSAGCGNGKSEIAAGLALCAARGGFRTWILDANTFSPAQDFIFGFSPHNPTFSDFLVDMAIAEMPVYPVNTIKNNPHPVPLFLTPSERNDPEIRFALQEALNSGADVYSRIPGAVYAAMLREKIDLLIIDTHPSFEKTNEVWMGMAGFLLITSRINPIEFESLRALFKDPSFSDIREKLVVFTNVQTDRSRNATPDMANEVVVRQLKTLREQLEKDACAIACTDPPANTRVHEHPFLYSEKLARFQQAQKRPGMFIDIEPDDGFSVNIRKLGDTVLEIIRR